MKPARLTRQVISISLSPVLRTKVERARQQGGYATTSEFFRDLLRLWEEEQVLRDLRTSQQEVVRGKAKRLRSLRDLR